VSGYKFILMDGPHVCDSESSAEYSDQGEEFADMYVGDMFDENGKPVLSRAGMTREQADRLRNRGRAGGQGAFPGARRQETCAGDARSR
jgi:hypothetical protein